MDTKYKGFTVHEKLDLHVSHDDKWLDTAEGEVPCSFTLVARCQIVLPM